jgi:transcriptional regulator
MDSLGHRAELLHGTLAMLILQAVSRGPRHGLDIARWIQEASQDVLRVEEGTLYPALHRLEQRGWVRSSWGTSEHNRRARFYEVTPRGANQLEDEREGWRRVSVAIDRVLGTI